jgi:diguanylate cyclase (GGDEF)-like protein
LLRQDKGSETGVARLSGAVCLAGEAVSIFFCNLMKVNGVRKVTGGEKVSPARAASRVQELEEENARLRQELEELKLIYTNTMEHGTLIENDLDERIRRTTVLSLTDPLTGIYNRLKLNESLSREMERRHERRHERRSVPCLIMFDIDHFKSVNDNYGHQVGDSILIELISLVGKLIRKSDVIARWGGEEFIILISNMDLEGTTRLADRIRRKISGHAFKKVGHVTCSFGVTRLQSGDSPEELLRRVDVAMYKAKQSGRNQVITL